MGARVIASLNRDSDWSKYHVVVAGIGIAGYACADALMQLGARVTVVDSGDGPIQQERAEILRTLEVKVELGYVGDVPACDLLVVSPGLRPTHQLITSAIAAGIWVWGELELAWRLRPSDLPAPLESMLSAGGFNAVAAGNIGTSLVDVVMHDSYEVIAVEVGAPQLPFVHSMSPHSAVCLNIADDHLDHFGSKVAYVAAKAKIFERTQVAAVYNADDVSTRLLVEEADVVDGCRAIGFTLGVPGLSMLGVVDGALVDRAFIPNRQDTAQELALVSDVQPNAPHNVANALAAARLDVVLDADHCTDSRRIRASRVDDPFCMHLAARRFYLACPAVYELDTFNFRCAENPHAEVLRGTRVSLRDFERIGLRVGRAVHA